MTNNVKVTTAEVFELVRKAKTKKQRIDILKQHDSLAVKSILRLQFDERFRFALPEGIPPEFKNDTPTGFGKINLLNSVRKLHLFIKKPYDDMKNWRREALFLEFISALDKDEAQLLIDVKDKNLGRGITRKIVDEAFPGLIPDVLGKVDDEEEVEEKSSS